VNVKADDGGCSSAEAGGSCSCASIAACAESRSEVSMSANVTAAELFVGAAVEAEDAAFSRFSQAAFSSSSLSKCQ
jgi:hypothetical protein